MQSQNKIKKCWQKQLLLAKLGRSQPESKKLTLASSFLFVFYLISGSFNYGSLKASFYFTNPIKNISSTLTNGFTRQYSVGNSKIKLVTSDWAPQISRLSRMCSLAQSMASWIIQKLRTWSHRRLYLSKQSRNLTKIYSWTILGIEKWKRS